MAFRFSVTIGGRVHLQKESPSSLDQFKILGSEDSLFEGRVVFHEKRDQEVITEAVKPGGKEQSAEPDFWLFPFGPCPEAGPPPPNSRLDPIFAGRLCRL